MSATQIRILDAGSWTVEVEEGQKLVACNPALFDALLAVAKALPEPAYEDDPGGMFCPCCGRMEGRDEPRIVKREWAGGITDGMTDAEYRHNENCAWEALNAQWPGWREWA